MDAFESVVCARWKRHWLRWVGRLIGAAMCIEIVSTLAASLGAPPLLATFSVGGFFVDASAAYPHRIWYWSLYYLLGLVSVVCLAEYAFRRPLERLYLETESPRCLGCGNAMSEPGRDCVVTCSECGWELKDVDVNSLATRRAHYRWCRSTRSLRAVWERIGNYAAGWLLVPVPGVVMLTAAVLLQEMRL